MGEIAEMIMEGILDEQTGEYIGKAVGYPRTMQPGYYNSVKKRKPKLKNKHAIKSESLGGLHLVGKKATIENVGECEIVDYVGKRGRKRYVLIDNKGNKHRKKFSSFTICVILRFPMDYIETDGYCDTDCEAVKWIGNICDKRNNCGLRLGRCYKKPMKPRS